ncbi:nephrocan-like [Clytia hemisphaerica]|uniref:Uncharacterized protein n=1 Tax=Clytia hemisphaerica TaxID=252671 RepID=A0A7M5UTB5_9CNID|eukprot:TCONS_00067195-protein
MVLKTAFYIFIVQVLCFKTYETCKCEQSDIAFCYRSIDPHRDIPTECHAGLKCDCRSKNLTTFPTKLSQTPDRVIWLNLADNLLTNITREDLGTFTGLRFLDLTQNPIQFIGSKTFLNSSGLIDLRIQTDSLKYNSLRGLRSLRELRINGNGILPELPTKVMSHLKDLIHLVISNTAVKKLPENFMNGYKQLLILDMRDNKIDSVDAGAFNNTPNIRELHLSHNHIKTVHHTIIKHASKLKALDLSHNDLTSFDNDFLANIPELYLLDLSHNKLVNITLNIPILTLDLSSNAITTTDDMHFSNSCWIQNLNVANNSIIKLTRFYQIDKDLIPSQYTTKLQKVDFSYNGIQTIDSDVFERFYELKKLNLETNLLSNIDHLILSRNVFRLYLADNKFTRFPNIIDKLKFISWLDLSNNNIKDIPLKKLVDLISLRYLNLKNNLLSHLPVDFLSGTKLYDSFDLSDNPLVCTCALRNILTLSTTENAIILGNCTENETITIDLKVFKDIANYNNITTAKSTAKPDPIDTTSTMTETLPDETTTKQKMTTISSPTKGKLPATRKTTTSESLRKEFTTSIVFNVILAVVVLLLIFLVVVLYVKYKKVYSLNAYHTKRDTVQMENTHDKIAYSTEEN